MLMVLIGPACGGMGTRSKLLLDHFGIPHLSIGEMPRQSVCSASLLGKLAGPIMDSGDLAPDELVIEIVRKRMAQTDCVKRAVFDGFPRTLPQLAALDALLSEQRHSIDAVIEIRFPEREIAKRIENCYREFATPRTEDRPDAIPRRLEVCRSGTLPILTYYEGQSLLKVIDGIGSQEGVFEHGTEFNQQRET